MILPFIEVDRTEGMGKGVFARQAIGAGRIIETAPVIVMSEEERVFLDRTRLHDYIFEWGDNKDQCCMALGLVPLYNHSYESNCEYEMDYENDLIHIRTVRDIAVGEELFINYNGDWNDQRPVWFETRR
jgi:SET domain-containing protein